MQSDSPESNPRLQRTKPGPVVATGFVDPCIFYLEATLPNEVPVLFACWARSLSETRKVDGTIHLNLSQVSVVKGTPIRGLRGWTMENGKTDWDFAVSQFFQKLLLIHDDSGWTLRSDIDLSCFQFDPAYGSQSSVKFIDAKTDYRLEKLSTGGLRSLPDLTKTILKHGPSEWPTLANALASFRLTRTPAKRAPDRSIIRRLISAMFFRKSKPVAA